MYFYVLDKHIWMTNIKKKDIWDAYSNNIENYCLVGCDAGLYFDKIVTFRSYQLHPSVWYIPTKIIFTFVVQSWRRDVSSL
jgi:hypothetical protein